MQSADKRRLAHSVDEVQKGNEEWWSANPMAYDWHGGLSVPRYSGKWFEEIDRRFVAGARLFATRDKPFDRIIPFEKLRGKQVLEIGCGMGLHTELMSAAGAEVTAIDISQTSVEATRRRLEMRGVHARVEKVDAEVLPFESQSFDFVWSWGVIHHSSRTGRAVRQIARVIRPQGEARVMVYNRQGLGARLCFLRNHLLGGKFLRQSFEETLFSVTDGFSARYYVRDQFEDLFRAFFDDVTSQILGQESDVVPLPARLRRLAVWLLPESYLTAAQAKRGGFIFVRASQPLSLGHADQRDELQ